MWETVIIWVRGIFTASKPQVADFEALSKLTANELERVLKRLKESDERQDRQDERLEKQDKKIARMAVALGDCNAQHVRDGAKIAALEELCGRQQVEIDAGQQKMNEQQAEMIGQRAEIDSLKAALVAAKSDHTLSTNYGAQGRPQPERRPPG